MRKFDLSEKKALVMGGIRSPGRAMVDGLLEAGAQRAIVSSADSVFATAKEPKGMFGADVVVIRADLSSRDQLRWVFESYLAEPGSLDILLVNHGIQ